MYSLYRSWLSRADPIHPVQPLAQPLAPLTLPDVVVAVGEPSTGPHQFAAHRAVLAVNSGYFKAALGQDANPTCVAVSGVTAEAFAPLLGFMYTGYLDIGRDNIYDVLLATHYLHMPRALELCWSFLRAHPPVGAAVGALDGGGASPTRSTLVKPIPGLPWRPALGPSPVAPQPPSGPAQHMVLPTAEHSPFRAPFLVPSPSAASPPLRGPSPRSPRSPVPQSVPAPSRHQDDQEHQRGKSASCRGGRRSPATPEETSTPVVCIPTPRPSPPADSAAATPASTSAPTPTFTRATASTSTSSAPAPTAATGKVVIDVACCDGPVRFHRVLNTSYSCGDNESDGQTEQAADENQLHQRMHVPGAAQLRRARVNRMADGNGAEPGADRANSEYTCLYCNHTFKSHYCYQKHARRHLNPLAPKQAADGPEQATPRSATATRTPARPLDMNVQYYPCKTCGSKFPSYYFVHKHRKLCHSGEEGGDTAVKDD